VIERYLAALDAELAPDRVRDVVARAAAALDAG
jgi:hypothetical protein